MRRASILAGAEGFTLIEMLVSIAAGLVVLLAAFAAFDTSFRQAAAATDRVEATQDGRIAMEKLLQELNSSCVWATAPPIQPGSDGNNLWFLSAFSASSVPAPTLHKVWLSSSGALYDSSYPITNANTPPASWSTSAFSTTPTTTHMLAPAVTYIPGASSIFQYYQFLNGQLTIDTAHQLPEPLSATSASTVGAVTIGLASGPSDRSPQSDRTINLTDTATWSPPPGPGTGCQ